MRTLALTAAVAAIACGSDRAQQPVSPVETADPPTAARPAEAPIDAAPAPPDAARPDAAPLEAASSWPRYRWDRAQAVVFNQRPYGPGVALVAYSDELGWNPTVERRIDIDAAAARRALELVDQTQGEMVVSKCPFPRHAIVLLQGERPVASINVCFECGDILIWPPYRPGPDWKARKDKIYPKLMKRYDAAFKGWKTLFEKDIGLPTEWRAPTPPR